MNRKINIADVDFAVADFEKIEKALAETDAADVSKMTELGRERKKKEPLYKASIEWKKLHADLEAANELLQSKDPSLEALAKEEKDVLLGKIASMEADFKNLLYPPDPKADRDTIVEIRAGAGGDEAGLFAADLFRMYSKFAQSKGLELTVYSSSSSGLGGFKEIIFGLSGVHAYGWFRYEQGVHRVQRVPATEAQGRIHTSTVTVAVLPEATEVEIKVDMKDLRIDTYRASGAGGQHVNKTESAIRITHIPTGLVVQCQEERSQGQNRYRAMILLRARLQELEEKRLADERKELTRQQIGTGDRSEKIRTYNFPQDRITDHRINFSVFNIMKVMEGDLEELIAELKKKDEESRQESKNDSGH